MTQTAEGRELNSKEPVRGGFAVTAFFALAPIAAVAGGLALVPLQALAALGTPWKSFGKSVADAWLPLVLLMAFVGWVCFTATFSPFDGSIQGFKLAGGVLAGLGFIAAAGGSARTRSLVRSAGVWSAAAFLVLLSAEAFFDMPFNRMFNDEPNTGVLARNPAKGVSILVVIVWGAIGALIGGAPRERLGWKILAAGALILGMQFDQNANALGWACGAVAFAVAYLAPRIAPVLSAAAIGGWLLAAPFLTTLVTGSPSLVARLPESWQMRTMIWDHAIDRIHERPLLGWGVDAARTFKQNGAIGDNVFALSPLHSHSFSLHVWLETGAIGAILLASALVAGGFYVSRVFGTRREASAALCGGVITAFAMWNVSYGAWQEWFVTAPFIVAGMAAAAMFPETGSSRNETIVLSGF